MVSEIYLLTSRRGRRDKDADQGGTMRWIIRWWNRRLRSIDIKTLWPSVRDLAPDLHAAHRAFAIHARIDPAWADLTEPEIADIVRKLG